MSAVLEVKFCGKCQQTRDRSQFYRRTTLLESGWQWICKPCARERDRGRIYYTVPPPSKRCGRCGEVKPSSDFHRHRRSADGLIGVCKPCRLVYRQSPAQAREKKLRGKYGITQAQYDRLHSLQGGRCAICGEVETIAGRDLAVDHCHVTGRVRGLLCFRCNSSIGKLGDSVEGVRRALEYLQRAEAGT